MEKEKKTLKFYLDSKNFPKMPQRKFKKIEQVLQVVDDQIVMNCDASEHVADGIVTSYTYKKKKPQKKRWSSEEDKLFYRALGCCGCDFSLMNLIFPGFTRDNLREKYKREVKNNIHMVEDALDNFNPSGFEDLRKEVRRGQV